MDLQLIRRSALMVVVVAVASAGVSALQVDIGRLEIERAIQLGRRGGDDLERFHRQYTIQVGNPTLQSFEVITEFRRVVLWAESRERLGERLFNPRDAEEHLRPWRGRLSIVAHVRFHPQNRYVAVPPYEMSLSGPRGTADILPLEMKRLPLYADTTLIGADIEGIFTAAPIAQSKPAVVLRLPPSQVAAATVDFSSLQ